jgi:hypothetical protein
MDIKHLEDVAASRFMPCSRRALLHWALIGLSIHILPMWKYYSLQCTENCVQWTKLSNTVMKNMGGSREKCKDGQKWENEANDSKKRNFTLGKVKTTKFVKETCTSEICEIFSNKFRKNIEIMLKSLEKAVLLVNTAVFTLPIITIMETHYLFWNFKKIWNISNKTLKILALLVASAIFHSLMCFVFLSS